MFIQQQVKEIKLKYRSVNNRSRIMDQKVTKTLKIFQVKIPKSLVFKQPMLATKFLAWMEIETLHIILENLVQRYFTTKIQIRNQIPKIVCWSIASKTVNSNQYIKTNNEQWISQTTPIEMEETHSQICLRLIYSVQKQLARQNKLWISIKVSLILIIKIHLIKVKNPKEWAVHFKWS